MSEVQTAPLPTNRKQDAWAFQHISDHYDTHGQLRAHLQLLVDAYNHARRPETLSGLTPGP